MILRRSEGFTFIELLVSIILILLLTGLLVAGYNRFNSKQLVVEAASTFKNNLRAIRTSASSGLKPEGCDTLVGYEVDFQSTTAYTAAALCYVNGNKQLVGTITPYTLPSGVSFVTRAGALPGTIIFNAVDQGVSGAQTIQLTGINNTASIQIWSSGAVSTQ